MEELGSIVSSWDPAGCYTSIQIRQYEIYSCLIAIKRTFVVLTKKSCRTGPKPQRELNQRRVIHPSHLAERWTRKGLEILEILGRILSFISPQLKDLWSKSVQSRCQCDESSPCCWRSHLTALSCEFSGKHCHPTAIVCNCNNHCWADEAPQVVPIDKHETDPVLDQVFIVLNLIICMTNWVNLLLKTLNEMKMSPSVSTNGCCRSHWTQNTRS